MDMTKVARRSEYDDIINACTAYVICEVWGKDYTTVMLDTECGYLASHTIGHTKIISWRSACRLYGEKPHTDLLDMVEV